jgi:membrane-associated phospholipid phosphatase
MIAEIQQFDTELFLKIHRGLSNDFFDMVMPWVRNRFFWSPLYIFIVAFCIKQFKKRGYYMIGMLLVTFALADITASRIIKPLVGRVRPCNDLSLAQEIIHRVPCGSGYSFPSSHATNHFAIAIFLICLFYRQWKPILPLGIGWALLVSFSQIYVGVHYPLDTFMGALIGTCIGFFTYYLYQKIRPVA